MNNDILEFLKENVKGRSCIELASLINSTFNTKYTKEQIKYYKYKYNLKSDLDTTFKKGYTPYNKVCVGYEFVDAKSGYTFIKNKQGIFECKQRYVYKKHFGNIPKGYSVVFLDSDKTNFDINNLGLLRNKDKLVMKNKHLFFNDKELTKTGILIAKVINTSYEKANK